MKDSEGILGKIFVFSAAPAITAGAVATDPSSSATTISPGPPPPSAAYGVATTVYAGDPGTDFPLAAIPQPGTAAIHFNIVVPGD